MRRLPFAITSLVMFPGTYLARRFSGSSFHGSMTVLLINLVLNKVISSWHGLKHKQKTDGFMLKTLTALGVLDGFHPLFLKNRHVAVNGCALYVHGKSLTKDKWVCKRERFFLCTSILAQSLVGCMQR